MKGMSRKDIILVTVLINAGLLAILFATAIIYDVETHEDPIMTASVTPSQPPAEIPTQLVAMQSNVDEMDQLLTEYHPPSLNQMLEPEVSMQGLAFTTLEEGEQEALTEVVVKKGDSLDKIARVHGTSVAALKKVNQLSHERLQIGQVLKIPKKEGTILTVAPSPPISESSSEAVYYVVKSGDNPWKIAKQHQVDYEQILRLNHLNEEKARNLRVGDRIRIK